MLFERDLFDHDASSPVFSVLLYRILG